MPARSSASRLSLAAVLACAALSLVPVSADAAARPRLAGKIKPPPAGRQYWGAFRTGAPYDRNSVKALEREAGRRPAIVMWYQEWAGTPPFPYADAQWLLKRGEVPMMTWEPWVPSPRGATQVVDQPDYRLGRIASGAFDRYIRAYARGIKQYGGPLFLRLFHEMDGDWYPWGGTVNGNTPADFVAAWRHVHKIFDAVGARNVTWVWGPNEITVPATAENQIANYWPGSAYVDWIGISGFNWGQILGWRSFDQIYGPRMADVAVYRKPVMLAELGSAEMGGDKTAWLGDTFNAMFRYPALAADIWYDQSDPGQEDFRIDSSPAALQAFRHGLTSHARLLSAPSAARRR